MQTFWKHTLIILFFNMKGEGADNHRFGPISQHSLGEWKYRNPYSPELHSWNYWLMLQSHQGKQWLKTRSTTTVTIKLWPYYLRLLWRWGPGHLQSDFGVSRRWLKKGAAISLWYDIDELWWLINIHKSSQNLIDLKHKQWRRCCRTAKSHFAHLLWYRNVTRIQLVQSKPVWMQHVGNMSAFIN